MRSPTTSKIREKVITERRTVTEFDRYAISLKNALDSNPHGEIRFTAARATTVCYHYTTEDTTILVLYYYYRYYYYYYKRVLQLGDLL